MFLKASTTSSGMVEGIWVRVLSRKGAKLSGELADEPDRMPGRHMHSKVTFTEAQIADWTYSEGGRHYGYFTTRVLAKRHPEDAERLKAELWENPLPPQPASKH